MKKARAAAGDAQRSQSVRPVIKARVPAASAPLSPADVASHGELYEHISFPNIPHWVAMCTVPLNAYGLASQSGNRAAQAQAVEDVLMLPQRVLTRTSRGPGDHKRLDRVVRARCRAVGKQLRSRYDCQPARDHGVKRIRG